jgi:hypothetical protein
MPDRVTSTLFSETSRDAYDFELLVHVINICVSSFGIIGNLFCILVLAQKQLLSRKFNFYLLILSFSELFYCTIILLNSAIFYHQPPLAIYDMNKWSCMMTDYVINVTDGYCVLLTLLLTVDRLHAIAKPMRSKQFVTNLYPKRSAFTSYLLVLFLNLPEVILTQRHYVDTNGNSSGTLWTGLCENRNQSTTRKEAYVILSGIVIPALGNIIPTLLIIVLNGLLLKHVFAYSLNLNRFAGLNIRINSKFGYLTATQKSHYSTIIIIGFWLLITSVPYYTFRVIFWISRLKVFQQNDLFFNSNHGYIQAMVSVLFNSNHSINIFIYVLFHRCFRSSFFNLITFNLFSKKNPLTINAHMDSLRITTRHNPTRNFAGSSKSIERISKMSLVSKTASRQI